MAAIGVIRKAGYVPVEDALFHYHEAKFRNMRPTEQWKADRDRLKKLGCKGVIEPVQRLEDTKLDLYNIVRLGQIRLFAWPAEVTEEDALDSAESARLPERTLGLSPTMDCKPEERHLLVGLHPDGVPVFSKKEFLDWLAAERKKGCWPSQEGRVENSERYRLSKSTLSKPLIRNAVETGAWVWYRPIAELARLTRTVFKDRGWGSVSDDLVTAALDELYVETGDRIFWTKGFARRNPELRGLGEPTRRLNLPILSHRPVQNS
jgi:hypothetical protein